jgi:hypothetical protein
MVEPVFKVHLAEAIGGGDLPIIITALARSGRFLYGELYLIIPGQPAEIFAERTTVDAGELPDEGPVTFDAEFFLKYLLDSALSKYLQWVIESDLDISGWISKPPKLLESNQGYLATLWMMGKYHDELADIRRQSNCQPLQEALSWLYDLPEFAIRPIAISRPQ